MQRFSFRPVSLRHSLTALALGSLLLAGGGEARAQATLALSPFATTTTVGSTVTLTVNLTGGTNAGGYDFHVFLDATKLKFVGTAPFTNLDTTDFPTLLMNGTVTPGDLRVSYVNFSNSVTNAGVKALGTFQVQVLSAMPLTGGAVTFGSVGSANAGGSELDDATTGANQLTAVTGATLLTAPEPSQDAALGLGLLGLGALALTARRRMAAGRK